MLKKNERNDIKEIHLKYSTLLKMNENILITPSFAIMINNYLDNVNTLEHNNFEYRKLAYLNKKNENTIKKKYNQLIVDLYQKGHIIINKEDCELKDLYILYQEGNNNYYLTYSKSPYNDFIRKTTDIITYDKAVKFIDSTAFILLINDPNINIDNNTIIVENNDILLNILSNWDGLLHNKIWFTDSISNKKILKED